MHLMKLFLGKVAKLGEKIDSTQDICPLERLNTFLNKKGRPAQEFELRPINKLEFRKLLKKRKGNRSCGIDFIDGYSLKLAAPIIEDILVHLVNLSLTSKFSNNWKVNKVTPRFKKGDKLIGGNWRPVTDIVFLSKLVEAAVYDQLNEFSLKISSGILIIMASEETIQRLQRSTRFMIFGLMQQKRKI